MRCPWHAATGDGLYDGLSFSDFKRVSSMTRARCFGTPNYLISVLTFMLLNSAASAKAEETAIEAIIANYQAQERLINAFGCAEMVAGSPLWAAHQVF
jgi:hypothetical protein